MRARPVDWSADALEAAFAARRCCVCRGGDVFMVKPGTKPRYEAGIRLTRGTPDVNWCFICWTRLFVRDPASLDLAKATL